MDLQADNIEIKDGILINPDVLIVNWIYRDADESHVGNTNPALAAFVTSYARAKLFNTMKEIEDRRAGSLLYYDTDSVIFKSKIIDPPLNNCGRYLGQLTDEFSYGEGSSCTKFTFIAPKIYGLQLNIPDGQTKSILKVKGIRLTSAALQSINFAKMQEMAHKYIDDEVVRINVPQFQIRPDSEHNIHTIYLNKVFKASSDKRRITGNSTLPYGYVD